MARHVFNSDQTIELVQTVARADNYFADYQVCVYERPYLTSNKTDDNTGENFETWGNMPSDAI